uniref:Uncharacterized protein n=1 Tax=Arundo donax TaxID=35708 RepID=A0A0A9BZC0_ARUDO
MRVDRYGTNPCTLVHTQY